MRKLFVVWNPNAGGKAKQLVRELEEFLRREALQFNTFDTSSTKSAAFTLQHNMDGSFTDLVIVGGDGTINEAINGLTFDIPVSIIPAGTGDDFVKMIDIGKTVKQYIETAVYETPIQIDLGTCNGRKFVNGVGIGFDGQIVEDMISKRVPLLKGHAAYYYHVLRILGGYREKTVHFQLGDMNYKNDLILLTVGNGSTFGGGFKLMPAAQIDDGLLEVCEIGKLSALKRFLNVGRLSKGTHGVLESVRFYQAKHVFIGPNPSLFAHIDGERLGNPPFEIRVLPGALHLRVRTI